MLPPLDPEDMEKIKIMTIQFAIKLALIVFVVLVAGCATLEEPPNTVTVKVQVPVPCIDKRVERPVFTLDTLTDAQIAEAAALNDYRLLMTLYDERKQRQKYEAEIEAQLKTCSEIPHAP